jgi:hypothetical protein
MAKISGTEEWTDAIKKHIELLDDPDEIHDFAYSCIISIAIMACDTPYETIGMMEVIKQNLIKSMPSI